MILKIHLLYIKNNTLICIVSIRILFECRPDKSNLSIISLKQSFDQFRRPITDHNIILLHAKIFGCQQGIDIHPGRILCNQRIKVAFNLVKQPLRREIRVYQIAEIQYLRISPISAIPFLYLGKLFLLAFAKNRFRDIQILNIVNLIPALSL